MNFTEEEMKAVFINDKGIPDVNMSKICGCSRNSMDDCEENCEGYYSCDLIAMANDMLIEAGYY